MTTLREEIPLSISYNDLMTCTAYAKGIISPPFVSPDDTAANTSYSSLLSQIDTTIKSAFCSQGLGLIIVKDIFPLPPSPLSNPSSTPSSEKLASSLQTSFEQLIPTGSYSMAFPALPMNKYIQKLKTVELGTDVPLTTTTSSSSSPSSVPILYPRTASVACQLSWDKDNYFSPQSSSNTLSSSSSEPISINKNSSYSVQNLSTDMQNVGQLMVRICTAIASSCDRIHNLYPTVSTESSLSSSSVRSTIGLLESSLMDAQTAKARLLHYYAPYHSNSTSPYASDHSNTTDFSLLYLNKFASLGDWQNWHFDYGLFTALTNPSYLYHERSTDTATVEQVNLIDGSNTDGGLVVLRPIVSSSSSALYPESHPLCACTKVEPVLVRIPKNAIAIQVGEAAQILSNGLLVATAHCVHRPTAITCTKTSSPIINDSQLDHVSRQIFVVFCQPPWKASLPPSVNTKEEGNQSSPTNLLDKEQRILQASQLTTQVLLGECECQQTTHSCLYCNSQRILPPLSERWSYGDTYTDLSKKTTKAYFGTKGVQNPNVKMK